MADKPMTAEEIAAGLDRAMRSACDQTESHRRKDAVIVPSKNWHRLMDLAEAARALLRKGADHGE